MYGTYLRLDVTVHDGWRAVIRAAARKLGAHTSVAILHNAKRGGSSTARCLSTISNAQHLVRVWRL